MTPYIQDWVRDKVEQYNLLGLDVLEVGSYNVNGSVRDYFEAHEYLGVDMRAGRGVDLVWNAHDLDGAVGDTQYDVVLCLETLEHDDAFWVTLRQLKAHLKPGGYLIITAPSFGFPEHRYPKDYWRFGTDAFEVFFEGLEVLEVGSIGPNAVAGIGRKL